MVSKSAWRAWRQLWGREAWARWHSLLSLSVRSLHGSQRRSNPRPPTQNDPFGLPRRKVLVHAVVPLVPLDDPAHPHRRSAPTPLPVSSHKPGISPVHLNDRRRVPSPQPRLRPPLTPRPSTEPSEQGEKSFAHRPRQQPVLASQVPRVNTYDGDRLQSTSDSSSPRLMPHDCSCTTDSEQSRTTVASQMRNHLAQTY